MESLGSQLTRISSEKATKNRVQQTSANEEAAKQREIAIQAATSKYLQENGDEIIDSLGRLAEHFARSEDNGNAARTVRYARTANHQSDALVRTMHIVGEYFSERDFLAELTIRDDASTGSNGRTREACGVETDLRITWGEGVQPGFQVFRDGRSPLFGFE